MILILKPFGRCTHFSSSRRVRAAHSFRLALVILASQSVVNESHHKIRFATDKFTAQNHRIDSLICDQNDAGWSLHFIHRKLHARNFVPALNEREVDTREVTPVIDQTTKDVEIRIAIVRNRRESFHCRATSKIDIR